MLDDEEPQTIRGLIQEPAGADQRSQSFAGSEEFWIALLKRTQAGAAPVQPKGEEKSEKQKES